MATGLSHLHFNCLDIHSSSICSIIPWAVLLFYHYFKEWQKRVGIIDSRRHNGQSQSQIALLWNKLSSCAVRIEKILRDLFLIMLLWYFAIAINSSWIENILSKPFPECCFKYFPFCKSFYCIDLYSNTYNDIALYHTILYISDRTIISHRIVPFYFGT